jgi:hypothetical protein
MNEEQDRWQALAEELGLPSEPKKTESAAPPRFVEPIAEKIPERAPIHAEPERETPRTLERLASEDHHDRALSGAAIDEPASLPPITSLDPPVLDPMIEGPSPDRLPDGMFHDESGGTEAERPRGRGGRRGQRGGRGGKGGRGPERSEPDAVPETAVPGGDGPPDESSRDDRSRRGGRGGRGRRPPERRPEPEPELEEVVADEEPMDANEEEFDDGPEDNLADLNVPPWADIIASLYRPDR